MVIFTSTAMRTSNLMSGWFKSGIYTSHRLWLGSMLQGLTMMWIAVLYSSSTSLHCATKILQRWSTHTSPQLLIRPISRLYFKLWWIPWYVKTFTKWLCYRCVLWGDLVQLFPCFCSVFDIATASLVSCLSLLHFCFQMLLSCTNCSLMYLFRSAELLQI